MAKWDYITLLIYVTLKKKKKQHYEIAFLYLSKGSFVGHHSLCQRVNIFIILLETESYTNPDNKQL